MTFEWVSWWNEERLHEGLGHPTPDEVEEEYRQTRHESERMETR